MNMYYRRSIIHTTKAIKWVSGLETISKHM